MGLKMLPPRLEPYLHPQLRAPLVYDMLVAGAKSAGSLLPGQLVERFKQALILWIVSYQISLAAVENHFFRYLLSLCLQPRRMPTEECQYGEEVDYGRL